MNATRRLILSIALFAGIVPAFAQAPPPVPALPDTERRTSYNLTASTCACAVGFALYGDSVDTSNWIEVWINGVQQNGNWALTSPTGPIASIPRPITDAVLTFTTVQTGVVQIVGARRPRRTSQFQEGVGIPTRNMNLVLSDLTAQLRENWDKTNDVTGRAVLAPPGETMSILSPRTSRANTGACFDTNGNLQSCVSVPSGTFTAGSGIAFTGTNPTVISTTAVNVLTPEQYGAVGDCVTDDQVAITNAINAAVSQGKTLLFSKSCYSHSALLQFGFNSMRVRFNGFVTLKLTGANTYNVSIDAGASPAVLVDIQFGRDNPPYLEGNATTISNLFVRSVHQGSWIEAIGGNSAPSGIGMDIHFSVGSTYRLTYLNNFLFALTSKPGTAIAFQVRNAGETVTDSDIHLIIEGMTNGVAFTGIANSRIHGYSENQTGTCTSLNGSGVNNVINNHFESWYSGDSCLGHGIVVDNAAWNVFTASTSSTSDLQLTANSTANVFIGGQYAGAVLDNGTRNRFEHVGLLSTFTRNSFTTWMHIYDGSSRPYADRPYMVSTFAAITATSPCTGANAGMIAAIADSNTAVWGANVAGGGTNGVLMFCDGANYTVFAK